MVCPLCRSADEVEAVNAGRWFCGACNVAFREPDPPRLIDYEPRRRRDVDE